MRVKVIALSCILVSVACSRTPAPSPPELSKQEATDIISTSNAFTSVGDNRPAGVREPRAHLPMQAVYALGAKGYLECTSDGWLIPTEAGTALIYWPTGAHSAGTCTPAAKFGFSDVTFSLNPCPRKLIEVTNVSAQPGVERTVGFTWTWDVSAFPSDARTIMFGASGEYPSRTAKVKFKLDGNTWSAEFGQNWEQ